VVDDENLAQKRKGELRMQNQLRKILGLALLVAVVSGVELTALGQNATRTIVLSRQAKLDGHALAQGKYSVAFDEKKDGEATISKEGKEVAKAAYKFVDLNRTAADSAVVYITADDGSLKIRRIEIKGMKTALQFD